MNHHLILSDLPFLLLSMSARCIWSDKDTRTMELNLSEWCFKISRMKYSFDS